MFFFFYNFGEVLLVWENSMGSSKDVELPSVTPFDYHASLAFELLILLAK